MNLLNHLISLGYEYRVRFVDYSEGAYTMWAKLTTERAEKLFDLSINEIQFRTPSVTDSINE